MKDLVFTVSRVSNGYTVGTYGIVDTGGPEQFHIAATQDEVAKVVKKICHGAFKDEKGEGVTLEDAVEAGAVSIDPAPTKRPAGDKK